MSGVVFCAVSSVSCFSHALSPASLRNTLMPSSVLYSTRDICVGAQGCSLGCFLWLYKLCWQSAHTLVFFIICLLLCAHGTIVALLSSSCHRRGCHSRSDSDWMVGLWWWWRYVLSRSDWQNVTVYHHRLVLLCDHCLILTGVIPCFCTFVLSQQHYYICRIFWSLMTLQGHCCIVDEGEDFLSKLCTQSFSWPIDPRGWNALNVILLLHDLLKMPLPFAL